MAATTIKDGFAGGSDNQLKVNADGSINTTAAGGSASTNIRDSAGLALNSSSGSLNVNITGTVMSGVPSVQYRAVAGVAMGATSTVISYTVPAGKTFTLQRVNFSSDSVSAWTLQLNSITNNLQRTGYMNFNGVFDYSGSAYAIAAGTVITIAATNNSTAGVAEFDATLIGALA